MVHLCVVSQTHKMLIGVGAVDLNMTSVLDTKKTLHFNILEVRGN